MHFIRLTAFLFFAALVVTGLSACDFSEQNYDMEPGDELEIRTASGFDDQVPDEEGDTTTLGYQRFVPEGETSLLVFPFTIDKEYSWSVEGPADVSTSTRRDGEYLDVTFEEPGNYTVTVESSGQGDEYSGSFEVEAVYPDVATQASRFSGLFPAFGADAFADILGSDPHTVLAPTDSALIDAFGETEDGGPDYPASPVLEDLVQYHALEGELSSGDITSGAMETLLEGANVTFDVSGETITIADGSPTNEDATITNADISATNGFVHSTDNLLLPPFASMAFLEQSSAGDTVEVASVYLPEGGFVAIHDSTYDDGQTVQSVIGASEKLEAGVHNDVPVALFNEGNVPGATYTQDALEDSQTLISVSYQDTNDDDVFDFVQSGGAEDEAYTNNDGSTVIDNAAVEVIPGN